MSSMEFRIVNFLLTAATLMTLLLSSTAILAASDAVSDYVYVYQVEGGKAYMVPPGLDNDNRKSSRLEVFEMEVLRPGTLVEASSGARIILTCAGCNSITITGESGPFRVHMNDFKREKSISRELLSTFKDALLEFINPASEYNPSVSMAIRGATTSIWPANGSKIGQLRNIPFMLKWANGEGHYSVIIRERGGEVPVFSIQTTLSSINVPSKIFKPGMEYSWTIKDEETLGELSASFQIISKDESEVLQKTLDELSSLLPPGADDDTKHGLQAGYLFSRGFKYNVMQLLENEPAR